MNLAEDIARILLEVDEPNNELGIDPADIVGSVMWGPDDFTLGSNPYRFAGRWPTGHYDYPVYWKRRTYKGRPIYLGVLGRVERDPNARWLPIAHEGEWYISSVPYQTVFRPPRGFRVKPGAEGKFTKTRYGYGRVRMKGKPQTFTKYFKHWWQAAAYLARMIIPNVYIKMVENKLGLANSPILV